MRNSTTDLFRFFGAVAVIVLHSSYGNMDRDLVIVLRYLARWAVPFFFMISGYYVSRNYNRIGMRAIKTTIRNIFYIVLISNLVYFLLRLYIGDTENLFGITTIYLGFYYHLWFINTLLLSYLFLFLALFLKISNKALLISAIFILLISTFKDSYNFLIHINISFIPVKLFIALGYLLIGFVFQSFGNGLLTKRYLGLAIAIIGFICQLMEAYILKSHFHRDPFIYQFLFGAILFSFGIFIYSVGDSSLKSNKLSIYGEKYSLGIYLYHPLIYVFLYWLLSKLNLSPGYTSGYFQFIILLLLNMSIVILFVTLFPGIYRVLNGKFNCIKS